MRQDNARTVATVTRPDPGQVVKRVVARCVNCNEIVVVENGRDACACTRYAEAWGRERMGLAEGEPWPAFDDPRWARLA